MPGINYYNDNLHTAWPFVDPVDIPLFGLVDAGFVCGPTSGFRPDVDTIYLHDVYWSSGEITFDVRSTAPGLENKYRLVFSFTESDEDYSLCYAEAEPLVESDNCSDDVWSGYLVVGSLLELSVFLQEQSLNSLGESSPFEPTTIQLVGRVLSINIANEGRTKVRDLPTCDEDFGEEIERPIHVVTECQTGPVRFHQGYNVEVDQDTIGNRLTFSAGASLGLGTACEEVKTHPAETPDEVGGLLTGGPRCEELLSAINGVRGANIRVFSEQGVRLTADAANNVLSIAGSESSGASCDS